MIRVSPLRSLRGRLVAGSSVIALSAAGAALAQQTSPDPSAHTVSGVVVVGEQPADYKVEQQSLLKLTQPVLDTPTITTTISRQVIEDRGATSLPDVFRNASGISLGAGESSWQGTNLTLRGFNARNDLYLDGMRDFGSYYRDPFDLEEVEVLQGPSSLLFGRGSTGGAINQVSKTPTLAPHIRAEANFGTDDTRRGVADIDEPIPALGEGAALRLVVMGHESRVAGRDEGRFRRYGIAPSLALGLGTPTRLTLTFLHQQEDDVPDYGIPWLLGRPAPVPRNSFYGFTSDHIDTDVDIITGKLEHDFGSALTVRTQLRYAQYDRNWRETEPQPVTKGVTAATPLSSILVNRAIQAGNSRELFLQDQTDLIARFNTGFLHHTVVAGFEIGPESSTPEYDNATGVPQTTLLSPTLQPFAGTIYPRVRVSTTAFTVAGYVIDTVAIGRHLELTGGIRYDSFQSDYEAQFYSVPPAALGAPTTHASDNRTDEAPSYRAGIVYKPTSNTSVYFDYSTSFNPSAESLSEIVAVRSFNQGNINLPPEKNRVFEAGAKAEVLQGRVLLQTAVFREEKYNARVPDPLNPGFNTLGGDQRVDGVEVEAVGRLTARWQINASYTNLHSQVIKSAPGGPAVGIGLFNAPDNAFALFTTYQVTDRLAVGGGMNLISRRYGQDTPPIELAPGYTTGDLMLKYQLTQNLRLQVNVFNVSDAYYIDQVHGYHLSPGPGRSALFTIAAAL